MMVREPRPITIVGNTGILPLTKGQQAIIDAGDAARVGTRCWFSGYDPKGKRFYAACATVNERGRKSTIKLHRFILGITDPKVKVDHKNHNGLDNRRENLRDCTQAENGANSLLYKSNKIGHKGILQDKRRSPPYYGVQMKVNKVRHAKWGFATIEEAVKYREEFFSKLHGEFYCAG
jgi:hypothetical protein